MSQNKSPGAETIGKPRKKAKVPNGVFWADYIKTLRDDPLARLDVAQQNMPYPAAFREAIIALRALIRERRKQNLNYEDLLTELYQTAARENFLLGTPYIEELGVPGFNVSEKIPKKIWKNLEMPYDSIGYEKLSLLNQTDKKWLVEAWGEPTQHQSAQSFHREIWHDAVEKCKIKLKKEDEKFHRELEALVKKPVKRRKQTTGCLSSLIGYVLLGIGLLTILLVIVR